MTFFLPALVFIVLILLVLFGKPKPKPETEAERLKKLLNKLYDEVKPKK